MEKLFVGFVILTILRLTFVCHIQGASVDDTSTINFPTASITTTTKATVTIRSSSRMKIGWTFPPWWPWHKITTTTTTSTTTMKPTITTTAKSEETTSLTTTQSTTISATTVTTKPTVTNVTTIKSSTTSANSPTTTTIQSSTKPSNITTTTTVSSTATPSSFATTPTSTPKHIRPNGSSWSWEWFFVGFFTIISLATVCILSSKNVISDDALMDVDDTDHI